MPNPVIDARTKALFEVGFVQKIDAAFILALFSTIAGTANWMVFGHPTAIQLIACGIGGLAVLMFWVLVVLFRCMWFVIQLMADMKMLPASAAKLALQFSAQAQTE